MSWQRCLLGVLALAWATTAAAEHDEAWVKRQMKQIKDSDTTAWRKIPWTASLLEARRASENEKKPLFLFTHDGNIETGRC
jgi:hypothetical protein